MVFPSSSFINIVSRMPEDMMNLFEKFVKGASNVTNGTIAAVVILAVITWNGNLHRCSFRW